MRKLSVLLVLMAVIMAVLTGCAETYNSDGIVGTWYDASDDQNSVMFCRNGTVLIQGDGMGVGLYTFDSREMDGLIFLAGIVPRIQGVYLFLDDTLSIGNIEYVQ